MSSQIQGCVHVSSQFFSLLATLVHSHLPTFRCSNVWVSQVCLSIEWEILCWTVAVQIVEISRGETKGITHTTVPLTLLPRQIFWNALKDKVSDL